MTRQDGGHDKKGTEGSNIQPFIAYYFWLDCDWGLNHAYQRTQIDKTGWRIDEDLCDKREAIGT